MIYYIAGTLVYFIFQKIKNKIICKSVNTGVKLLLYKTEWHSKNQQFYYDLLDWLII